MLKKTLIKSALFLLVLGLAVLVFLQIKSVKKSFSFIYQLFFTKTISLRENPDKSINILLMGVGGRGHDGPDLTDTIIFVNLDPAGQRLNLISIPRDLWIPQISGKINSAYALGKEKDSRGILLSDRVIEDVIGKKIDYTAVVNFSGFVRLVDYLGGIDVNVVNSFDDYEYPIDGKENDLCGRSLDEANISATFSGELAAFPCRYEHISFKKGLTHMDGATALKFVRSRHAPGEEGTDFARSKRQEEIIRAVKQEVLSAGTVINPLKLIGIFNILRDSLDTDINLDEVDDFIRLFEKAKTWQIKSSVIDMGDAEKARPGLLINPSISSAYGNAWVLIPRKGDGDFSEIISYIDCLEKNDNCQINASGVSNIIAK